MKVGHDRLHPLATKVGGAGAASAHALLIKAALVDFG